MAFGLTIITQKVITHIWKYFEGNKTNSDYTVGPMRLFPVSIVIVQKTLDHVLSAMCEQRERERERERANDRETQRERERVRDRQTDRLRNRELCFICLIVLLLYYKDFCDFNNFIKRFNTIRNRSIREKSISHDFSCNNFFNLICQKFSISAVTSL